VAYQRTQGATSLHRARPLPTAELFRPPRKQDLAEAREQTRHAVGVETIGLAMNGTRSRARLFSAERRRGAKEHNRAKQLIDELLRPGNEQLELLPIVGRDNALTVGTRHASPP